MKKLISQPNYEQNIPEDVRAANLENVSLLSQGIFRLRLTAILSSFKPTRLKSLLSSSQKLHSRSCDEDFATIIDHYRILYSTIVTARAYTSIPRLLISTESEESQDGRCAMS